MSLLSLTPGGGWVSIAFKLSFAEITNSYLAVTYADHFIGFHGLKYAFNDAFLEIEGCRHEVFVAFTHAAMIQMPGVFEDESPQCDHVTHCHA